MFAIYTTIAFKKYNLGHGVIVPKKATHFCFVLLKSNKVAEQVITRCTGRRFVAGKIYFSPAIHKAKNYIYNIGAGLETTQPNGTEKPPNKTSCSRNINESSNWWGK